MSAIWMWVRSEWRRGWGALLVLGVLVAVAGGVTLAVAAGARRADTAMDRFLEATNQPEIEVAVDFPQEVDDIETLVATLPSAPEMADRLAAVPGVEGVTVTNWIAGTTDVAGEFFNGGVGAQRGKAPSFLLIDGRWPEPDQPNEVMVGEAALEAWDLDVGDTVPFHTLAPHQMLQFMGLAAGRPEGPVIDVRVVGVIRDVEEISDAPEPFLVTGSAFVDEYSKDVLTMLGIAELGTTPDRVDEVIADVQEATGPGFRVGPPPEDYAGRIDESVSVEVTALWAFAAAAAAAGLVIVFQAMSRQTGDVARDRFVRQTLGFTRRDHVIGSIARLGPAVLVGVIGSVALAVALSPLFPRGMARRADPAPGVFVDRPVLVVGGLAVLVVGIALAAVTSRGASDATVRVGGTAPAPLDRLAGSLSPAAGLGMRFALAPRGRVAQAGWAGITGAAVAVAGLLAVAAVDQSVDRLMTTPRLFGAGWDATAEINPDDDLEATLEAVAADPDVAAVGRQDLLSGDVEVMASGPDGPSPVEPEVIAAVRGAIAPTVTDGRLPTGSSEVAIGAEVARRFDVDLGDTITVDGRRDEVEFVVVGRVVTAGTNELGNGFVVTGDGLESLAAECSEERDDPLCGTTTLGIGVSLVRGADRDAALARLAAIDGDFAPTQLPSVVNNLSQIGSTPWYLAGFLAVLGVAGLAHAVTVGSRKQRRDLAVARALGFRPGQAASTVRGQALVLAITGALIGVLIGVIAGRLVWQRVASGTGALVETVVPAWAWVASPLGVLTLAIAIAIVPATRSAATRPATVLRSE